jgi:hypothetical protein
MKPNPSVPRAFPPHVANSDSVKTSCDACDAVMVEESDTYRSHRFGTRVTGDATVEWPRAADEPDDCEPDVKCTQRRAGPGTAMCNLYSITKSPDAIRRLFGS